MIDPELQHYLSGINQHLTEIKNKKTPGIWRSFFNGIFGAFGYILGLVLAVVLIVFILNKLGLLVPVEQQWQKFQNFMTQAQSALNSSQQGSPSNGSVYTLPDGSKVKVVPAQ